MSDVYDVQKDMQGELDSYGGHLIRWRIQLATKTICVLNTIYIMPDIDPASPGCFIRYQHGNVAVRKHTMSCAWVLRVVEILKHTIRIINL